MMEFTLNLYPNQKGILFADQIMSAFMRLYNLPYNRELCFVLHELIINAVEAMKLAEKSKTEKIQIHVEKEMEEIQMTVIDTAGGIPQESWKAILLYNNIESTFSERGRGLFFVKNMVDQIWFDNLSETRFLVGVSKKLGCS